MTPAEYQALKEEILSGPKAALCAPFVVTNEMPKDLLGFQKDSTIAEILSQERPAKVVSKEVGDGAISLALGIPAGPLFLWKLRRLAATVLPADATDEQILPVAFAAQAVKSLEKTGLDIGDTEVRNGLNFFIGTLLTAEQVAAIKALAEVPDSISAAAVSKALRGPWN